MKNFNFFLVLASIAVIGLPQLSQASDMSEDLQTESEVSFGDSEAKIQDAKEAQVRLAQEKKSKREARKKLKEAISLSKALQRKAQAQQLKADRETAKLEAENRQIRKQIEKQNKIAAQAEIKIQKSQDRIAISKQRRDETLDQKIKIDTAVNNLNAQIRDYLNQVKEAEQNANQARRDLDAAIENRRRTQARLAQSKVNAKKRIALANAETNLNKKKLQSFVNPSARQ